MGKRGPKPKSKRDLHASGSWRAAKRGEPPQSPKMDDLTPPKCLKDNGREWWNAIVPDKAASGLVRDDDRMALTILACCVDQYHDCLRDIAEHGLVVRESGKLPKANPAVQTASMVAATYARYSAKFGLTPLDRDGLSVPAESSEDPEVAKLFEKGA